MVLAGLGAFDTWPVVERLVERLRSRTDLAGEQARVAGRPAADLARAYASGTLLERATWPLAQVLMRRASMDQFAWVEQSYDLLGRDKGATDFYVRQVLSALAGLCVGFLFGTALTMQQGLAVALLVLPVGLSALFCRLPELELKIDLRRRREQILYEVPHQIDRLLVNVMAYRNIADGLKHTVDADAEKRRAQLLSRLTGDLSPEQTREAMTTRMVAVVGSGGGGYFARELMQVYAESLKNGNLKAALLRMAERNADVPLVARCAERLAMSYESGASLVAALQDIGKRANDVVENLIQARGEENLQAMIAPSAIALAGVFVAIGAPAARAIFLSL